MLLRPRRSRYSLALVTFSRGRSRFRFARARLRARLVVDDGAALRPSYSLGDVDGVGEVLGLLKVWQGAELDHVCSTLAPLAEGALQDAICLGVARNREQE